VAVVLYFTFPILLFFFLSFSTFTSVGQAGPTPTLVSFIYACTAIDEKSDTDWVSPIFLLFLPYSLSPPFSGSCSNGIVASESQPVRSALVPKKRL